MNKGELTEVISWQANIHKVDADKVINSITNTIVATLRKGGRVTIKDFGSFYTFERAERIGRNPKTGTPVKVKGGKTVKFKVGTAFSDEMRN